jgi:hypothetical protein
MNDDPDMKGIKSVKERNSLNLLSKMSVLAVGIGTKVVKGQDTGEPCIKVYVREKYPESFLSRYGKDHLIPKNIEGVKSDVVEMSELRQFDVVDVPPEHRRRLRPAPGGCSISHYAVNGRGTLTCWVKDKKTHDPLLLSCWHVIAYKGMGIRGDPILQPGRKDGGKLPDDTIALLERWVDVKMLGPTLDKCKERIRLALENKIEIPINKVDAALAKPVSDDVVSYEILGIGKPKVACVGELRRGAVVLKSGATTGVTRGIVQDTDVDIFVLYPSLGVALFKDQILVTGGGNYAMITPFKYVEQLLNCRYEFLSPWVR